MTQFPNRLSGFIPTVFRTKFSHSIFSFLFPRDQHMISYLSASNIMWYVYKTKLPLW